MSLSDRFNEWQFDNDDKFEINCPCLACFQLLLKGWIGAAMCHNTAVVKKGEPRISHCKMTALALVATGALTTTVGIPASY